MTTKARALGLAFFLVGAAFGVSAQIASPNRVVSERFIGEVHPSVIPASLKVSPDGKHVAYVVAVSRGYFQGIRRLLVVDGEKERPYDDIAEGSVIFSPDSQRVAYQAIVGSWCFMVVDGKEEKQYDGIATEPIFSPDSRRMAYGARVGNKWFVVVDGKEEKHYDDIARGTLTFSPDSKRVAYGVKEGNKWFVVVDGNEGTQYDILRGARIVFDRPDSFHYLVLKGGEFYLVEERIE